MVEKKINLNQPILSVRRHAQRGDEMDVKNAFPHPYRSELNSGSVGAVPFQWERAPGKPKEQQTQYRSNNNFKALDYDEFDSLSRTESFLSSSSISSLTGMDDQKAGELMMDLSGLKKQSAVEQQLEEVKKEMEREESDENENLITVCCLLPRSCITSSVCHLNPVAAMNLRTRLAMFQARGIQSCSSSADLLSETENEDTVKAVGKTGEPRENKSSFTKQSGMEGFKTLQELLEDEKKVYEDTEKQIVRAKALEKFGVAPPLPRSPSDSWLFRTVSTRKASTRFTNKS